MSILIFCADNNDKSTWNIHRNRFNFYMIVTYCIEGSALGRLLFDLGQVSSLISKFSTNIFAFKCL